MIKFNDDIIRYIAYKLDFYSILNFSIINKNNYNSLDNNFYHNLAYIYYTKEFWDRAKKRPIHYSLPLKSVKKELIRIENFQKSLDELNNTRWTEKDFYDYWNNNDKYYINNKRLDIILNML